VRSFSVAKERRVLLDCYGALFVLYRERLEHFLEGWEIEETDLYDALHYLFAGLGKDRPRHWLRLGEERLLQNYHAECEGKLRALSEAKRSAGDLS